MTNIKISFDFEANVQKFITLSSDDFIGKSYLVLNKIQKDNDTMKAYSLDLEKFVNTFGEKKN